VPIYVQESELEAAQAPLYTVSEWVRFPGAAYRPVRGSAELSPNLAIVATPGHTPGHQSVVVRSNSETRIIVGQAAYTAAEFEAARSASSTVPDGTWSPPAYVESLARLHSLNPESAWFSHDSRVWTRGV
jgi:N-acyl homoserine lactone hydrolase